MFLDLGQVLFLHKCDLDTFFSQKLNATNFTCVIFERTTAIFPLFAEEMFIFWLKTFFQIGITL